MDTEWLFADPKNVAVYTVRQVVYAGHPILRVTHDEDDGAWQFLEWGTPSEEDGILVTLESIVRLDPSVAELHDLPFGWRALRKTPETDWTRGPKHEEAT